MRGLFCLEADRADGRPLGRERGAKVVFELSASLDGLLDAPAPGDPLFPGYAKAKLAEIPEIESDSREFRNQVSVQVVLLGDFDDLTGHYGQVWDMSGDRASLAFSGQVTRHLAGVGAATLTLSDIPVESINAQVPARTVEAESFPGTRDSGATVPVVVGRALRHRCPHLASGYELQLAESVTGEVLASRFWDTGTDLPNALTAPGGIAVLSATEWYVVDDSSDKVYKTTDGGTTWDTGTDLPNIAYRPYGIAVLSATELFVADDSSDKVYKTTDGGTTWDSGTDLPNALTAPYGIAVLSATEWFVVDGTSDKVYKTTDGGTTWDTGTDLPNALTVPGGIAVLSATEWYVVDENHQPAKVYKTTDGGTTWDTGTDLPNALRAASGIAVLSATEWFVVSSHTDKVWKYTITEAVFGDTVLKFKDDSLTQYENGVADYTNLKKCFPVAAGDLLSVGIGETDADGSFLTEVVRVASVDLKNGAGDNLQTDPPEITIARKNGVRNDHTVTAAQGNTPAVDVIVANHGVVRDYLLGEGVARDPEDSSRSIHFRRAYRAYHDGRALPYHKVEESGVLLKFSATPAGSGNIRLDYEIPTGYELFYNRAAEGVDLLDASDSTRALSGSSATVGSLEDGTEYTFFLEATKTDSPTFYATVEVTPDATDTTAVHGHACIQLPDDLTAPLDDWYTGFVLELLEDAQAFPETRALRVESYETLPEEPLPGNLLRVRAPNANFSFARYSMREYRFFDGSQETPYPGFAFVRFAVPYDGEIRADVQGFALERPQHFIRELLRNETWGGKETDTFHLPAATDPRPPGSMKLEMSLTSTATAHTFLREAQRVRRFHLFRRPDGVHVTFPEGLATSRYLLPSLSLCAKPVPTLQYMQLASRFERLAVRFRPDPSTGEFRGRLAEEGTVAPREIELPYVYDAETARQCLWYRRKLHDSDLKTMRVAVPYGRWQAGEIVKELEPLVGRTAGKWRVKEATERVGVKQDLVLGWIEDVGQNAFRWSPDDADWPYAGWNRDIHIGAPAPDFSQTPPPPVRSLDYLLAVPGDDAKIALSWLYREPLDNVSGVQIEAVTGAAEDVFTIRQEVDRRSLAYGSAEILVSNRDTDATVRVYTKSPHNNLRGFPVELTLPLASRHIHVATTSSALSSEPSITSTSFNSGSSRTIYVKLPQKPTHTVTIRITKTGSVAISKVSMTFSTTNYGVAQSVVLSGGAGTVKFAATSSDTEYQGKTHSVNVSVQSVYTPTPKMATPTGLRIFRTRQSLFSLVFYMKAAWYKVPNATSYVYQGNKPGGSFSGAITADTPSIVLDLGSPASGTYSIEVKAKAPGYLDSNWASASHIQP